MQVLVEAARSLLAHPLRSLLTVASVAFGAAVLHVLVSYASGIPETTASILRSLGGKDLRVEPRRAHGSGGQGGRRGRQVRIRYDDIPAVRAACPSVAEIAPAFSPGMGGPVFSRDNSWPWAQVTGVSSEYKDVTDTRVVEGRWFTKEEELARADVALISKALAEGVFEGRSPLGEPLDCFKRRFEVIGVYESTASIAYSALVPYPTAMELGTGNGRYVSHLAFSPRRPELARQAVDEMRTALGALYSFDPSDTSALDVKENLAFVDKVEATSLALSSLVLTIAVLALVLGCLGAANVVGIAVSERTTELGLRRALGATAARIKSEVLAETLLLACTGGAIGLLLGQLAARALGPLRFTDQSWLVPRAEPTLLVVGIPVLVLTAVLAGLPAARRAAKVDPGVLLRAE